jgi:hypothetical protein
MSVAYYIVLDNKEPGFETFVNGKAIAHAIEELDALCDKVSLPKLDSFIGQPLDEIADLLGEEIELPEGEDGGALWFEPQEGINLINSLIEVIQKDAEGLTSPIEVIDDLTEYKDVLTEAIAVGAKWHLALDC